LIIKGEKTMSNFINNKTIQQPEKALQRMENEGGIYSHEDSPQDIKILLVEGSESEASNIKEFLQKNATPSFQVYHYTHPPQALQFLKEQHVDIVLLDFGTIDQHKAQDVFQKIQGAARDTPIIIFTGEAEHDLALIIMKEGADDRITKEQFTMSRGSLRDTIEFSLAKRKALIPSALKDARESGAAELRRSEEKGAAALQAAQTKGAAALRADEEKAAVELGKSHAESAVELEKMNKERSDDIRGYKQTLSWMGGGYSVESVTNIEERGSEGNAWQFIAAELKHAQEKHAAKLKEAQRKEAVILGESEQKEASDLKGKQLEEAKQLRKAQDTRT
jgi:DNA-binding response OmpR family regulator